MKKYLFSALLLSLTGCMSATIYEDNVCASKDLDLPGVQQNLIGEQTVSKSVSQDLSGSLSKVKDIGQVDVVVNSLTFSASTGDLTFIKHITVVVSNDSNSIMLTDTDIAGGTSISVPVNLDTNGLADMLMAGPVSLTVNATGDIPSAPTHMSSELCVGAVAHVKKSLSDL